MYFGFNGMRCCSPSQVGTASSCLLDESSLAASGFGRVSLKEKSERNIRLYPFVYVFAQLQRHATTRCLLSANQTWQWKILLER